METVLNGYVREEIGSKASDKLRKDEKIPAVLYGKKTDNVHFSIDRKEFEAIVRHQERLLNLSIGKAKTVPALIQDVQYEPITDNILHIDFLIVKLDEKIEVDVPVELMGAELSPGVQEGGNLETILHEITVVCFPDKIPEKLVLDISAMAMGETLTIADMDQVEGVAILTDAKEIVASVSEPVDVEAETDLEESLQEIETGEPTVQKQKDPDEVDAEEKGKEEKKG